MQGEEPAGRQGRFQLLGAVATLAHGLLLAALAARRGLYLGEVVGCLQETRPVLQLHTHAEYIKAAEFLQLFPLPLPGHLRGGTGKDIRKPH